jgi:CheY-like chemotaxis protein/signal transduction histidine kinase
MAQLMGYNSPENLVREMGDLSQSFFARPRDYDEVAAELAAGINISGMKFTYKTRDGKQREGLLHLRPTFDSQGKLLFVDGSLSHPKGQTERVQSSSWDAVRSRTTRRFIETLSKEMRAPMNAIMGMADLLANTDLSEQQTQYVQTIKSAGESLLGLAANVIFLSRMEARTLELEKIPFSLLELVEKTCEALAVKAHEKNLDLACTVLPGVSNRLVGDPFHLRQVLVNVASYAMEAAREGQISVTVKRMQEGQIASLTQQDDSSNAVGIEFSVSCAQYALPTENLADLFDHDSPLADGACETEKKLGLKIASQLVHLMGGRIAVKPEKGAICFTAILQRQPRGQAHPAGASLLKDMNILVADNDVKGRNLLKEILNEVGARVTEADDAQTAITLLRDAWMLPKPYDMLLISQVMPDMGGLEATEIVRIENLSPLCILILPMSASYEELERAREKGIAYFLRKPFKRVPTLKVLRAAMRREALEEDEGQEENLPPVDILLVEDSETNRFVIRAYLKNTPCRIHIAENGEKAVEKFTTGSFDLVLMDMQMPVMDGYEALSKIRKWEKENAAQKTPIIAMTADAGQEDEIRYIDTGFDGFLSKPIKKNLLLSTLVNQIVGPNKLLPKRQINRIMDTLGVSSDEPILAWVNPDLEEMAPQYLEKLAERAATVPDLLAKGDFESIKTLGHQMKGEGNAFGFEAIGRLGAVIEEAAGRRHEERIIEFTEKLKDYLARVEIV